MIRPNNLYQSWGYVCVISEASGGSVMLIDRCLPCLSTKPTWNLKNKKLAPIWPAVPLLCLCEVGVLLEEGEKQVQIIPCEARPEFCIIFLGRCHISRDESKQIIIHANNLPYSCANKFRPESEQLRGCTWEVSSNCV